MIEEFREKLKEEYFAREAEYERAGKIMSWEFRNGYMTARGDAVSILKELLEGTEVETEATVKDNGVTW